MRTDRVTLSRREYDELRLKAAAAGQLPSGLLTVREVSKYTRMSTETVRKLIRCGVLEAVQLSDRCWRVWAWSLRALLEREPYGREADGEGEKGTAAAQEPG